MSAVREWLWLANVLGPDNPRALDVMRTFERPEDLRGLLEMALRRRLLTLAETETARRTSPGDFAAHEQTCLRAGWRILTFADDDYPEPLRELCSAPPVLYVEGDVSVLRAPLLIGVIGTRRPSAYGVEATRAIAGQLAKNGAVIVSGMAAGLDGEAHKAALAAKMPTVACVACGLDRCYPAAHRALKREIAQTGAVVSEYPPGTPPMRHHFLQRNRLIAGLPRGVCVAEARLASGTMNTVSAAIEFGRDVFAVPGSIFSPLSEGTNDLIKNGAAAVTGARDILAWYGLREEKAEARPVPQRGDAGELSDAARTVRGALTFTPRGTEELCEETGLAPRVVLAALTELELEGMAEQTAGRLFRLPAQ